MPYENCNLREWPFRTAADENFASIWAGRTKTKVQLDRLLKTMSIFPNSGLHVFWANFGMGKTHTLYHLKYRCKQTNGQLIPIYAVMPKRSTGFLELYREIVQAFLSAEMRDYLGKQLVDLAQNSKGFPVALHSMFSKSPGVVKALLAMRNGDIEETTAAMQWLTAKPGLPATAMKSIGVNYRIRTPEDAINSLCSLIKLALWTRDNQQKQLVLMIDEYQRVGELNQRIANENNSCLHTIFNEQATGLQIILSFSFGKKNNVGFLLSDELKSRSELHNIILDVLSQEEGEEFLRDLFSQFRIQENNQWAYPFTPESINKLIMYIAQRKVITPRRIMLYFDHVLEQYLLDDDPPETGIPFSRLISYLDDPSLGTLDIDVPKD